MPDDWADVLTRRLEQVLNVHPEKYHHGARSERPSRASSPVGQAGTMLPRARSIDYLSPLTCDNGDTADNEPMSNHVMLPVMVSNKSSPDDHRSRTLDCCIDPDPLSSFDLVTLNISGLRFQTRKRTLDRYPNTLLGNPFKRARFWNPEAKEYFFDRHRSSFEPILFIYQSNGQIKRPETVDIDVFVQEMRFFQMGDEMLKKFWITEGYEEPPAAQMPANKWQRRLWELMEYPDSSLAARVMAFLSIFVIVTSIIFFCLETLPDLRGFHTLFSTVELICIVWFTIELVGRFIGSPSKRRFVRSFLNIIDFIAIAPFFVSLVWPDNAKSGGSSMSFAVLRVLRLVRVFRIFKLSRHSVGLQILGKTFRASVQEFCLLIFFLGIALVLFSSGVFFAEQGEPDTKFTSIPASFWFVLVTMTTVGYGDLTPTGVYGKLVGGMCALIGVLTLALPIPIIVANFKHYYRQENRLAIMRDSKEGDEEHGSMNMRKNSLVV